MLIVKNKVFNIKVRGKGPDCVWHTFYRGQSVPANLESLFLARGGDAEKVEEKKEVKAEVKPILKKVKVTTARAKKSKTTKELRE
tara:strand:- start:271 stop:525 length:255 start_codon:yes stop_codon:yes gene_type:complete